MTIVLLDSHPFADGAVPANDARVEPGVGLDDSALEQRGALDARAVLDHHARAYRHVGPYAAVAAYFS